MHPKSAAAGRVPSCRFEEATGHLGWRVVGGADVELYWQSRKL